jgi:TolB protein
MRKKSVIRLWLAFLLMIILLIQPVRVQAIGEPDITVSPTAVDFATIEVYSSSPPETVTITNNGTADLTIGTISITGTDADRFSKQNDYCSEQTLGPDNSADLEVVFRPDTTSSYSATLSIPCNDPDEGLITIPMSGIATRSSYTDKPICTEDGDQGIPAIYWDRIVWQDRRTGNAQIYMYDLTAEAETEIHDGGSDPAIWGDRIVWSEYATSATRTDIYLYDLTTDNVTEICTASKDQVAPVIWGDRIVWQDYRNSNQDIYMYDLSTGQETAICTEESNQWYPAIWGDYIVWQDDRNNCLVDGNADIYLYDLSTSTETQITTDPRAQGNPAIWGNLIVWEDDRNGNRDIYMYDMAIGELTAVCTEIHRQDSPAISENYIVWEDWRGADKDIYLYELATGAEVPLCTESEDQLTPAIWGHRVVWEDARTTGSGFNADIYSSAWLRHAGADLSIGMTDLIDPIEEGYYLTYILEVTNYGLSDASGVVVTDTLPNDAELISATTSQGTCAPLGDDHVLGNIGSVAAGDTVTLTIVVRPDNSGVVTNEATVEANEADFLDYNNTATESTRVSSHGIVRAAGRWATCVFGGSIPHPPVFCPCRFGAWHPSLAPCPDGEVHLSYTREGSGCMEHIANDVTIYHFDDIYYTSTESAWFNKQQIYEGYGTTHLMTVPGSWNRKEAMWSATAADDAGNLHVAYVKHHYYGTSYDQYINSSYYLMYVNNVSGTWSQPDEVAEFVEIDNGVYGPEGGIWDVSLAVDSAGDTHITYMDTWGPACNGDLIYATNQSGSWTSQVLNSPSYNAYDTAAMVLDSNDHLHISFYSPTLGGLAYLTNAPFGQWQQPEQVDSNWSGGQLEGMYTDIAVDAQSNPHISYVSGGGAAREDTCYATRAGDGTWSNVMVDEGAFQSACNTIAVDSSGEAHIAYYHVPTEEIRYATSSGGWQPETIDDEINCGLILDEKHFPWNDIAVDAQDKVHIVYSKNDFIYHATRATLAGEDIDHDGVSNEEEQGPDGLNPAYDYDSDGTADYEQGNVASLHTADGTYYVTVVSDNGTLISNFQTVVSPSPGDAPAGVGFPFGFFDFNVYGLEPGGTTTVDICLPASPNVESYYMYGATSDNLTPHWYEFLYDGETGAEINGNVVTLYFVDGGRGDGDVAANGVIWEPGGPSSVSTNTPPTVPVVDITPESPLTEDDLICTVTTQSTDDDDDDVTYTFEWYKNDVIQPAETTTTTGLTDTVSSALTVAGETWKCVVTPNDGIDDGLPDEDQVVIGNTPPTEPVVDVTPKLPDTDDDLVCTVTTESTDADGVTVSYTYEWYKDDVLQPGETTATTGLTDTVSSALTAAGETWKCVVTPNDGTTDGTSADGQTIIVADSRTETIVDGILDATEEADTEAVVTGSANVTVARYVDNPGASAPGGFTSLGKYIDVNVDNTANVDEIEIRNYYTVAEVTGLDESSLKLTWWDGAAWVECSDSGATYPAGGPAYRGYVWAKIRADTTPALADLTGTPFMSIGTPPAAPPAPLEPPVMTISLTDLVATHPLTVNYQGIVLYDCQLTTDDGRFTLDIAKSTTLCDSQGNPLRSLSVASEPSLPALPSDRAIVMAYNFAPDGATFIPAITLTATYDPQGLQEGVAADDLYIACWDGSQWIPMEATVNAEANTVSCQISHFTIFAVIGTITPPAPPAPSPPAPSPPVPSPPTPPVPAVFSVSDLTIRPAEVKPEQTVTITVSVSNTGGTEGDYLVVLKINGVEEMEKSITVAAGKSTEVSFSVAKADASSYNVVVDELSGSFTVVPPIPLVSPAPPVEEEEVVLAPVKSFNWPLVVGIIAAVIIVGTLSAFFFVRRRA